MVAIPESLKKEYPFSSHYLKLQDGLKLHYVDEGNGSPIVMLHGNPTWSFFYRNLIKHFSGSNRVVVPDHMGMGLSDKPQDYQYTLENHINNLETLIANLGLEDITLVVHYWGGAIGFGYATRNLEKVKKVVIMNTALLLLM